MNVSQEGYRNPRKGREDQEKNQEEKTASRATCRPPSRQALGTCLNGIIDDLRGRRREETGSRPAGASRWSEIAGRRKARGRVRRHCQKNAAHVVAAQSEPVEAAMVSRPWPCQEPGSLAIVGSVSPLVWTATWQYQLFPSCNTQAHIMTNVLPHGLARDCIKNLGMYTGVSRWLLLSTSNCSKLEIECRTELLPRWASEGEIAASAIRRIM